MKFLFYFIFRVDMKPIDLTNCNRREKYTFLPFPNIFSTFFSFGCSNRRWNFVDVFNIEAFWMASTNEHVLLFTFTTFDLVLFCHVLETKVWFIWAYEKWIVRLTVIEFFYRFNRNYSSINLIRDTILRQISMKWSHIESHMGQ